VQRVNAVADENLKSDLGAVLPKDVSEGLLLEVTDKPTALKSVGVIQARMVMLTAAMGLTACADPKPVPVEEAMAICTERARSAIKPDVSVGIGVGTGGYGTHVHTGIGIDMSSDYIKGTDPKEVYETCVVARSGEKPTEPLNL
jgi:hypothetical protein